MSEATNKPQSAAIIAATPRDNDRDLAKELKSMNLAAESDSETITAQIPTGCFLCHIPHSKFTLPVNGKMKKCAVCK